jgi:Mce-associated membrane protein
MRTKRLEAGVGPDGSVTDDENGIDDYDGQTTEGGSREQDVDDARADVSQRSPKWLRAKRILIFGVIPVLSLILAAGSGYLKWQVGLTRDAQMAAVASVQAATENTVAILSYQPDTVDKQLNGARDRLAEPFKDQYTKLISDVVIPGSKQKKISAVATVPAAASMSATANHAVVLVFIDQSIVIGTDAPTSTSSTVRVTLDKEGDRWLISQFEPV